MILALHGLRFRRNRLDKQPLGILLLFDNLGLLVANVEVMADVDPHKDH